MSLTQAYYRTCRRPSGPQNTRLPTFRTRKLRSRHPWCNRRNRRIEPSSILWWRRRLWPPRDNVCSDVKDENTHEGPRIDCSSYMSKEHWDFGLCWMLRWFSEKAYFHIQTPDIPFYSFPSRYHRSVNRPAPQPFGGLRDQDMLELGQFFSLEQTSISIAAYTRGRKEQESDCCSPHWSPLHGLREYILVARPRKRRSHKPVEFSYGCFQDRRWRLLIQLPLQPSGTTINKTNRDEIKTVMFFSYGYTGSQSRYQNHTEREAPAVVMTMEIGRTTSGTAGTV